MKFFVILLTMFCVFNIHADEISQQLIIGKIQGSELIVQEVDDYSDYTVVKGKTDEEKYFEDFEKISGKVIRSYFIAEEQSTYGIYKSYIDKLKNEGFNILFKGEKEELGGDFQKRIYNANPWDYDKNFEYSTPFTMGKANTQYYISASKDFPQKKIYVTINTVTGWTKFPAYRIDIINTDVEMSHIKSVEDITLNIMKEGKIDIYDIIFEKDELVKNEQCSQTLNLIADYIKQNNNMEFFIVAHTDNTVDLTQNIEISLKKSKIIMDILTDEHKISKEKLSCYGLGSLCPVFSNKDSIGRKYNNRVSLVVKK